MIDVDQRIGDEVDRLLPVPGAVARDWDDVVERSRGTRRGPKRLLVAAAVAAVVAVVAATPLGATIARTAADFSAWIRGEPGTSASPAEQQAFQEANERTWAGFPPQTKLRRLIETSVAGTAFTLYGFRSGESLCLRLLAGENHQPSVHCAPLNDLQRAATPALVVAADEPIGDADLAASRDAFLATFGIASDGVRGIAIHADDGNHHALVAANAFLYIAAHPQLGTRVRGIEAIAGDRRRVALGFASAPYGMFDLARPPTGSLHGPSQVERHVTGGTIGWLERLERRGDEVAAPLLEQIDAILAQQAAHGRQPLQRLMARALQPDSGSPIRIVLVGASASSMRDRASEICQFQVFATSFGGGCSPVAELFKRGPLQSTMGGSGASQYTYVVGVASDDVAAIKLYLGDGRTIDAPLENNAYAAKVARSAFPLRIVAFDAAGRVIAIDSFENDGMSSPAPLEARQTVRALITLRGPHGSSLLLEAGEVVGGFRCWQISVRPNGSQGGGCTPWPVNGPPLGFVSEWPAAGDHFLAGELPPDVAAVEIGYPDGTADRANTPDGFLTHLIPANKLSAETTVIVLRAYDSGGRRLAQRGLAVQGR